MVYFYFLFGFAVLMPATMAHAVEFELPSIDETTAAAQISAPLEYYVQFLLMLILISVTGLAVVVLLSNIKKYYNTQTSEEKDKIYKKIRDSLISLGVVLVSILALWALYPEYLSLSPSHLSLVITTLF
jgi:hypothetical protein